METIVLIFWASLIISFYAYLGYGMILYVLVSIKRYFQKSGMQFVSDQIPEVTLLICAYNEIDFVQRKVENSYNLDYPDGKIRYLWVTDGSTDGTETALLKYPDIKVLHNSVRNGKIGAINRGMEQVTTPFVIFSDANAMLNKDAVKIILREFLDPATGCVSGEKRISGSMDSGTSAKGEGAYWKYESFLKKLDSELYSAVGAAGELFAIRTELFEKVEHDMILDDFIISMRIALKGYKIKYTPDAYASESASANVNEELKRKIRIAAGGIQSIIRLSPLLNIFKYRMLSFQYLSHRVLRWTIIPILLPVLFILNIFLLSHSALYEFLFIIQVIFYISAIAGWIIEKLEVGVTRVFYIPYYFFIMNYAVYRGMLRLALRKQAVNWERAIRGY